jgi:hypothetical protein
MYTTSCGGGGRGPLDVVAEGGGDRRESWLRDERWRGVRGNERKDEDEE